MINNMYDVPQNSTIQDPNIQCLSGTSHWMAGSFFEEAMVQIIERELVHFNQKQIRYKINENSCWICISHSLYNRYPTLRVNGRYIKMHRYIYMRFRGPIPRGLCVLHACDNPACINPAHLWLGTHRDNMKDAARKGRLNGRRRLRGEGAGYFKLTIEQILMIRKLLWKGMTQEKIAQRFGVVQATISMIHTGKNWAWLESSEDGK
jgi:DNA-binding XRE family transcriptional regulator